MTYFYVSFLLLWNCVFHVASNRVAIDTIAFYRIRNTGALKTCGVKIVIIDLWVWAQLRDWQMVRPIR